MTRDTLITARKARLLTQTQVAEFIGVTQQAIARWERGSSTPDTAVQIKVAALLGVKREELFS